MICGYFLDENLTIVYFIKTFDIEKNEYGEISNR